MFISLLKFKYAWDHCWVQNACYCFSISNVNFSRVPENTPEIEYKPFPFRNKQYNMLLDWQFEPVRGVVTPIKRSKQHRTVKNDAAFSTMVGEAANIKARA